MELVHPLKNELRCHRLIDRAIKTFSLDLRGYIILTEAATSYYMLTPFIAALSGAEKVYALTNDSSYGLAKNVQKNTMDLARNWGVENKIEVLFNRDDPRIGKADIITNLGFVRPLNSEFLHQLKYTAVIPLMWETWEHRPEDLDLAECRRLGIPVLGTNERHPDLQTFRYIGHIAVKLLFTLQIEVFLSNVAVLGGGVFAKETIKVLKAAGALVKTIPIDQNGNFDLELANSILSQADALVVVEHRIRRQLIGDNAQLTASELHSINPSLAIAHICGGVDHDTLIASGLRCSLGRFASPGHMTHTTDYLGPRPLIDLHTSGLKVGQVMTELRHKYSDALEVEIATLKATPLSQGFYGYHDLPSKMGN